VAIFIAMTEFKWGSAAPRVIPLQSGFYVRLLRRPGTFTVTPTEVGVHASLLLAAALASFADVAIGERCVDPGLRRDDVWGARAGGGLPAPGWRGRTSAVIGCAGMTV